MAISDQVSGISCEIIVNNKPLSEHPDLYASLRKEETACYVKVEGNESYSIRYTIKSDFDTQGLDVACYLVIDGEDREQRVHPQHVLASDHTSTFSNIVYRSGEKHKSVGFRFGGIKIGRL